MNSIKFNLLLAVILLLSFFSSLNSQWINQNLMYPNEWFFGVSFINENTGTVVGSDGMILRTINGGVNWTLQNVGVTSYFFDVCFVDANTGWIVGQTGRIYHTTNGGVNWISQNSGISNQLNSVFFVNVNTGMVVGNILNYSTLRTTNGGENWISVPLGYNSLLNGCYLINADTGFAFGGAEIFRTTNGGISWTIQATGVTFMNAAFTDANTGIVVGGGGMIRRSTDGGVTWVNQTSGTTNLLWGISLIGDIGTATGWNGTILHTTNGGQQWSAQSNPATSHLYECSFVNANSGWAAGNYVILHTTNGGITFINNELTKEIPQEFFLSQNYPNPFNPSTLIKFSLPKSSYVKLSVYDVTGKEIGILADEKLNAGNYSTEFDGGNLSSGMYFYRLVTADFTDVKKMVLVK